MTGKNVIVMERPEIQKKREKLSQATTRKTLFVNVSWGKKHSARCDGLFAVSGTDIRYSCIRAGVSVFYHP